MLVEPFTQQEREGLLRRYSEANATYNELMDKGQYDDADRYLKETTSIAEEYFERLPRMVMGCCPFDGQPLVRTFDPYGLDGFWWDLDATPQEAPTCPHFCLLLGAVNFNGRDSHGGDFEVRPGPQAPYVIPRLLDYPEMIAVISHIEMDNGYVAYPITYFAERRPPPQDLTTGWARAIHSYTTQLGESAWREPNDSWDFDLRPWLEKDKVRWCEPESGNQKLSDEPPERCPYVDLPGERQRMVVRGKRFWTEGLPG